VYRGCVQKSADSDPRVYGTACGLSDSECERSTSERDIRYIWGGGECGAGHGSQCGSPTRKLVSWFGSDCVEGRVFASVEFVLLEVLRCR
jgi:hypothetical protein